MSWFIYLAWNGGVQHVEMVLTSLIWVHIIPESETGCNNPNNNKCCQSWWKRAVKPESFNIYDRWLMPQTYRHCFLCPHVTSEASGHLSAAIPASLPSINYPLKVVNQTPAWGALFLSCQLESTNVQMRPRRGPDTPVWALWLVWSPEKGGDWLGKAGTQSYATRSNGGGDIQRKPLNLHEELVPPACPNSFTWCGVSGLSDMSAAEWMWKNAIFMSIEST